MCRFMAYMGTPVLMADLVTRPKRSIVAQSFDARERLAPSPDGLPGSINADGFGVGWFPMHVPRDGWAEEREGEYAVRGVPLRASKMCGEGGTGEGGGVNKEEWGDEDRDKYARLERENARLLATQELYEFQAPCVLVDTRPAWSNENLQQIARVITAPVVFTHVRAAYQGMPVNDQNCHPFRAGRYMFMHNGGVGGFTRMRRRLIESLGETAYECVAKSLNSDSAVCFGLFLNTLDDIWEPLEAKTLRAKLEQVIDLLRRMSAEHCVKGEVSLLNFALSDGHVMLATRVAIPETAQSASLYYAMGSRFAVPDLASSPGEYVVCRADRRNRVVLVASEPLTEHKFDWIPMPPNSMLIAFRGGPRGPEVDVLVSPVRDLEQGLPLDRKVHVEVTTCLDALQSQSEWTVGPHRRAPRKGGHRRRRGQAGNKTSAGGQGGPSPEEVDASSAIAGVNLSEWLQYARKLDDPKRARRTPSVGLDGRAAKRRRAGGSLFSFRNQGTSLRPSCSTGDLVELAGGGINPDVGSSGGSDAEPGDEPEIARVDDDDVLRMGEERANRPILITELPNIMSGHGVQCPVTTVLADCERRIIFSGSTDRSIRLWSLDDFSCMNGFKAHDRTVVALALEAEGCTLISAGADAVKFWNVSDPEDIYLSKTIEVGRGNLTCLAFGAPLPRDTKDDYDLGRWGLYVGCQCPALFEATVDPSFLCEPTIHEATPDDETSHYGSVSSITRWCRKSLPHGNPATATLLAAAAAKSIDLAIMRGAPLDVDTPEYICTASFDSSLRVWREKWVGSDDPSKRKLELVSVLHGHKGGVTALAVSGAGHLLSASRDKSIRVWDFDALVCHSSLSGHRGDVLALATPPGRDVFTSASADGTIRVWSAIRLDTRQIIQVDNLTGLRSLTCTSDSIIAGASDGLVRMWPIMPDGLLHESGSGVVEASGAPPGRSRLGEPPLPPASPGALTGASVDPAAHPAWVATPVTVPGLSAETLMQRMDRELEMSLRHLVGIKSVTSEKNECWRAAKFLMRLLESLGAETSLMIKPEEGVDNPVVVGRLGRDERKPTVTLYGHYDVQPADEVEWRTDPFKLHSLDGYFYGRGATDNKGPLLAMIYAVKELVEERKAAGYLEGDLPVNFAFLFEGQEEVGSRGFREALLEKIDWFKGSVVSIICNTYWIGNERPCLVYGMRGMVQLSVEVDGPERDVHSGVDGGVFNEPMSDLVKVLASLVDSQNKILIPGFYDAVVAVEKTSQHSDNFCSGDLSIDLDRFVAKANMFSDARTSGNISTVCAGHSHPQRISRSTGPKANGSWTGYATGNWTGNGAGPTAGNGGAGTGRNSTPSTGSPPESGGRGGTSVVGKLARHGLFDNLNEQPDVQTVLDLRGIDFDIEEYRRLTGLPQLTSTSARELLTNRWCNPSLSIVSIVASSQETTSGLRFGVYGPTRYSVIPHSVRGQVSIRFVPRQNADDLLEQVRNHIAHEFGKLRSANRARIEVENVSSWWFGDRHNRFMKVFEKCLSDEWGQDPLYVREGGTMPVTATLEDLLKCPVMHVPLGQNSDSAHLANERLRRVNLLKGKNVLRRFFETCVPAEGLPVKDEA